mgnify:CR=1 FL=1
MKSENIDFFEIEKKANQLRQSQREIIQQILDKGFTHQEANYSLGYIRGVEDLLNSIFQMTNHNNIF